MYYLSYWQYWEWGTIANVISSLIATAALLYSVWQGKIMRQHNMLSVEPVLSSWLDASGCTKGKFAFTIENKGLGPAKIISVRHFLDGDLIEGERPLYKALVTVARPLNLHLGITTTELSASSVVSAQESIIFYSIETSDGSPLPPQQIIDLHDRLDVEIRYSSFYKGKPKAFRISDDRVLLS